MNVGVFIGAIRSGRGGSPEQMYEFGSSLAGSRVSDAQLGAFAMAVCMNGLSIEARVELTKGMRDSGELLKWDLPGPVLDKHSTGGVGDPVSLLLAPALASCGAFVPMVSGRGLGHTGGTLDKLEAIPGYASQISNSRFRSVVKAVGCAIVGTSNSIAPSDKRLYAIRDVTSTVDSVDLITASILSKKLAVGLDGLVLDIKTGSGAVIKVLEKSILLAESLVEVANGAGCPTVALITDMSQPLTSSAGNALEIRSVMGTLDGSEINPRLLEVTVALGAKLIKANSFFKSFENKEDLIRKAILSGRAMESFSKMVAEMGGPKDFAESWKNKLPEAPVVREVFTKNEGYINAINTEKLGQVVLLLGGGRLKETGKIDPAVGLSTLLSIGDKVDKNTPIATIHASSEDCAEEGANMVSEAYSCSFVAPKSPALIYK